MYKKAVVSYIDLHCGEQQGAISCRLLFSDEIHETLEVQNIVKGHAESSKKKFCRTSEIMMIITLFCPKLGERRKGKWEPSLIPPPQTAACSPWARGGSWASWSTYNPLKRSVVMVLSALSLPPNVLVFSKSRKTYYLHLRYDNDYKWKVRKICIIVEMLGVIRFDIVLNCLKLMHFFVFFLISPDHLSSFTLLQRLKL